MVTNRRLPEEVWSSLRYTERSVLADFQTILITGLLLTSSTIPVARMCGVPAKPPLTGIAQGADWRMSKSRLSPAAIRCFLAVCFDDSTVRVFRLKMSVQFQDPRHQLSVGWTHHFFFGVDLGFGRVFFSSFSLRWSSLWETDRTLSTARMKRSNRVPFSGVDNFMVHHV
jgi:hypothetical protein